MQTPFNPALHARAAVSLALLACLAGAGSALHAAPYTPAGDDERVQRLPGRLDATARAQRAQLARDPTQLPLALAAARAAIDRARLHGDPRELGLAQAALAPWWALPEPPPAAQLLRATVRQSQHQFAAALVDLEALAAATRSVPPEVRAQAELTRATVLQLSGRLGDAQQVCDGLASPRHAGLGEGLNIAARACSAELRSLRGQAPAAQAELALLAQRAPDSAWLALVRAELAERQGDPAAAEARYREAVAGRPDVYTLSAFADWLLDQGRAAEALAVIARGDDEADALLLRRAIARQRLGDPRAAQDAATLQARFDAARQRGEAFHAREEARLALDIEGQPARALVLARANWAQQKEPADALLLMRAAVRAGDTAAADPVRRLRDSGWVDVRLASAEQGRAQGAAR